MEDSAVSSLLQQFIQERETAADQRSQKAAGDAVTRSQREISSTTTKVAPEVPAPRETETTDDPVRFDSSGNVQVYIHVESTSDDTLQQLRNLGANTEIVNSDSNVVQARVAPSALDEIAALNAVQEIGAPDCGVTKVGSINTEGDGIHRADLVRAFSGLAGKGIKVGVISEGINSWGPARTGGRPPF